MQEWKVDTEETILKCVEHDEDHWMLNKSKFIKDPAEYPKLRECIETHMGIIKEVFIHIAAKDNFPEFGLTDAERFGV